MNRRATGWLVATFLVVPGTLLAQAVPDTPIHTSKTRFRIPFRFDARELERIGAREVRLYVSTDEGSNWRVGGTTTPAARRFDFRAPNDGSYWFAVRTVDGRNELHPPGRITNPALKVVVDTRPPRLAIELREVQPGRVELGWRATDPNVDTSRLRLEYLEPGETRWRTVSIVPRPSGRTAWTVARPGVVAVRGVVSDRAENTGSAKAEVRVGRGVARPRDPVPDLRQPIAEGNGPDTANPPRTADASQDLLINDSPSRRPAILEPRHEKPMDPVETAPFAESPNAWPPAAPARARVVNSRRFSIDYEVSDVGPSGLGALECFITTDDGSKWWRYGADEDRRSPMVVTVPRDGVYGFALRARSGVGLAADPPQPGEKPTIVVAVDRTAPEVQLQGVTQGTGAAINQVLIRWTLQEANPAEDAVALSYATSENGPWRPITGWMPDRGRYVWKLPADGPSRFHVRVTARDAAGNVTVVGTKQPVVVDLARPSARIVDVQPESTPR